MYIPPFDKDQLDKAVKEFLERVQRDLSRSEGILDMDSLRLIECLKEQDKIQETKEKIREDRLEKFQKDLDTIAQTPEETKKSNLNGVLRGLSEIWVGHQNDKRLSEVLTETIKNFLPDTQEIEIQGTAEAGNYFENGPQPSVAEFEAYLDGYQAGAKYILGGLAR